MNTLFESKNMRILAGVVMGVLAVFLLGQAIASLKAIRYVGVAPTTNTISVSGHGEVLVVPDLATITFSVEKTDKVQATANTQVTGTLNNIKSAVLAIGVAEKDFQTSNYNVQPQYDYSNPRCTATYCPATNPVLTGYRVSNSVTITVHKDQLGNAGKVLTALTDNGATNVSGINLSTEDENQPQDEARAQAISKAQAKAQTLAKQLGVRIVGISSFSESAGGGYPYYAKTMSAGMDAVAPQSAPTPVSLGQNKVSSDVSITYQIQ